MGVELRVETWQKPQICIVVEALRMHLFIQERVEYSGWPMQAHKPNLASAKKFYWNTVMFVTVIYGGFCASLS